MPSRNTIAASALISLCTSVGLAACSATSAGTSAGPVQITCASCQPSLTDPVLQHNYEAAQRFNDANEGKYIVQTITHDDAGANPHRLAHYTQLAMARDLPDVFMLDHNEIRQLAATGPLHDFAPDLTSDPAWADTFNPGAFDTLSDTDGHVWAIPTQQDGVGVFYNRALLRLAGYDTFPTTWDDFETLADKLKAQGVSALALDGGWATILMWSHLIGTEPDGRDFLTQGITTSEWSGNDTVRAATERLRTWHTAGYVGGDAFTGNFATASDQYLSGTAAAIPTGPWFIDSLTSPDAISAVSSDTGYAPSPGCAHGQGLITISDTGWVSGTTSVSKSEAVAAFLRHMTSPDELAAQARATGAANPPAHAQTTAFDQTVSEPMRADLNAQITQVTHVYPHAMTHIETLTTAWTGLWPSYVDGTIDTDTFLSRLAIDAAAKS